MTAIPSYSDIVDLIKKGATIKAQEKIMELRETALRLQEDNIALKERIKELEEQLSIKKSLSFDNFAYRLKDESSLFCQRCYDLDGKLVRLIEGTSIKGSYNCKACDAWYGEAHIPKF
jgi:hypothetical protein